MKQNKSFFSGLLLAVLINLSTFAQGKFDKWPEIKSFHTVISATFHPSETGDLEPIKKRSAELLKSASNLAASKIPAEFDKKRDSGSTYLLFCNCENEILRK